MDEQHRTGRSQSEQELETIPMDLDDAIDYHLSLKEADGASPHTVRSHRSRLGLFSDWLREQDVNQTTEINRRHLTQYYAQRSSELAPKTLKTQFDTIRVFLRNLEDNGAISEKRLYERVRVPTLSRSDEVNDDYLDPDRGREILDYLQKYEQYSEKHAAFSLFWVGLRVGAIQGIDVSNVDFENNQIELEHLPDQRTPLKSGAKSERTVAVPNTVTNAIDGYLDNPQRRDVTDEFGREPVFTKSTKNERESKQGLRSIAYSVTRPCVATGDCPHDRIKSECDAYRDDNQASQCPSSQSPHPIRSGVLTRMMENDAPIRAASDRLDTSPQVIEKHYNRMTKEEKAEQRRDKFEF